MFQERWSTLSIRCIKSNKLWETNFDEFLDDLLVKNARQNLINCLPCHFQPLVSMIVVYYYLIRTCISILTAQGTFETVPSHVEALVNSAPSN